MQVRRRWTREFIFNRKLTSNEGEGTQAGESAIVYVEHVKSFGELEDAVKPVAKAELTLLQCQDHTVAKRQLRVLRFRTVRQPQNEEFQARRLEKQLLRTNNHRT